MNNLKNDDYYVGKILKDLNFISLQMSGVTKQKFAENEVLIDSMMFRLIQISENAKKLSEGYKILHNAIPWMDIYGLRNRIVHDYGNVDLDVVYSTLTEDVRELIGELQLVEI